MSESPPPTTVFFQSSSSRSTASPKSQSGSHSDVSSSLSGSSSSSSSASGSASTSASSASTRSRGSSNSGSSRMTYGSYSTSSSSGSSYSSRSGSSGSGSSRSGSESSVSLSGTSGSSSGGSSNESNPSAYSGSTMSSRDGRSRNQRRSAHSSPSSSSESAIDEDMEIQEVIVVDSTDDEVVEKTPSRMPSKTFRQSSSISASSQSNRNAGGIGATSNHSASKRSTQQPRRQVKTTSTHSKASAVSSMSSSNHSSSRGKAAFARRKNSSSHNQSILSPIATGKKPIGTAFLKSADSSDDGSAKSSSMESALKTTFNSTLHRQHSDHSVGHESVHSATSMSSARSKIKELTQLRQKINLKQKSGSAAAATKSADASDPDQQPNNPPGAPLVGKTPDWAKNRKIRKVALPPWLQKDSSSADPAEEPALARQSSDVGARESDDSGSIFSSYSRRPIVPPGSSTSPTASRKSSISSHVPQSPWSTQSGDMMPHSAHGDPQVQSVPAGIVQRMSQSMHSPASTTTNTGPKWRSKKPGKQAPAWMSKGTKPQGSSDNEGLSSSATPNPRDANDAETEFNKSVESESAFAAYANIGAESSFDDDNDIVGGNHDDENDDAASFEEDEKSQSSAPIKDVPKKKKKKKNWSAKSTKPESVQYLSGSEDEMVAGNAYEQVKPPTGEEELDQLIADIRRIGDDGKSAKFGAMFDDPQVEQYYEALVGTLIMAKKRKLITFKGQMLLKGPHDDVVITICGDEDDDGNNNDDNDDGKKSRENASKPKDAPTKPAPSQKGRSILQDIKPPFAIETSKPDDSARQDKGALPVPVPSPQSQSQSGSSESRAKGGKNRNDRQSSNGSDGGDTQGDKANGSANQQQSANDAADNGPRSASADATGKDKEKDDVASKKQEGDDAASTPNSNADEEKAASTYSKSSSAKPRNSNQILVETVTEDQTDTSFGSQYETNLKDGSGASRNEKFPIVPATNLLTQGPSDAGRQQGPSSNESGSPIDRSSQSGSFILSLHTEYSEETFTVSEEVVSAMSEETLSFGDDVESPDPSAGGSTAASQLASTTAGEATTINDGDGDTLEEATIEGEATAISTAGQETRRSNDDEAETVEDDTTKDANEDENDDDDKDAKELGALPKISSAAKDEESSIATPKRTNSIPMVITHTGDDDQVTLLTEDQSLEQDRSMHTSVRTAETGSNQDGGALFGTKTPLHANVRKLSPSIAQLMAAQRKSDGPPVTSDSNSWGIVTDALTGDKQKRGEEKREPQRLDRDSDHNYDWAFVARAMKTAPDSQRVGTAETTEKPPAPVPTSHWDMVKRKFVPSAGAEFEQELFEQSLREEQEKRSHWDTVRQSYAPSAHSELEKEKRTPSQEQWTNLRNNFTMQSKYESEFIPQKDSSWVPLIDSVISRNKNEPGTPENAAVTPTEAASSIIVASARTQTQPSSELSWGDSKADTSAAVIAGVQISNSDRGAPTGDSKSDDWLPLPSRPIPRSIEKAAPQTSESVAPTSPSTSSTGSNGSWVPRETKARFSRIDFSGSVIKKGENQSDGTMWNAPPLQTLGSDSDSADDGDGDSNDNSQSGSASVSISNHLSSSSSSSSSSSNEERSATEIEGNGSEFSSSGSTSSGSGSGSGSSSDSGSSSNSNSSSANEGTGLADPSNSTVTDNKHPVHTSTQGSEVESVDVSDVSSTSYEVSMKFNDGGDDDDDDNDGKGGKKDGSTQPRKDSMSNSSHSVRFSQTNEVAYSTTSNSRLVVQSVMQSPPARNPAPPHTPSMDSIDDFDLERGGNRSAAAAGSSTGRATSAASSNSSTGGGGGGGGARSTAASRNAARNGSRRTENSRREKAGTAGSKGRCCAICVIVAILLLLAGAATFVVGILLFDWFDNGSDRGISSFNGTEEVTFAPTMDPTRASPIVQSTVAPAIAPVVSPTQQPQSQPTVPETSLPTMIPTQQIVPNEPDPLVQLISNAVPDGGASLADVNSPQFAAMQWVREPFNGSIRSDARFLERYALAVLYYSSQGEDWVTEQNWLTGASECNWFGVAGCDDDGRVQQLNLSENRLRGTIPEELVLLENLQVLDLSKNEIDGSIPTWLGTISPLEQLELQENLISSNIPSYLGSLVNLNFLDLASNSFVGGLPTEIGRLSQMSILSLYNNALTGTVPFTYEDLNGLRQLYIDGTDLVGPLPLGLCELPLNRFYSDCGEVGCTCCSHCCVNGENCVPTEA